jgi:hypothetical protein
MTNPQQPSRELAPTSAGTLNHQPDPGDSDPCDEAMISRQRQRYLASLLSDQQPQSDSQYREQ